MILLKQSTASQEVPLGYFVDSTDGDTAMTALTIANTDIKIWKNGATTLANKNSGGGTHISGGIYYAVLDATDTDTLGPLVIFVHVATALSVRLECMVVTSAAYDNLTASGTSLDAAGVRAALGMATANLDTQLGAIDDYIDTEVATIAAAVALIKTTTDKFVFTVANRVDATAMALATQAKADVNAEVLDVINVDTYAEPGQGAPAATLSLAAKIGYLFKLFRNRKTQSATQFSLFNDAETVVDQKSTISQSSGTVTRGEIASGP